MVKLSSRSGVVSEQTAEALVAADRPVIRGFQHARGREEEKVTSTLVVSLGMIMFDELGQRSS